MLDEFKQAYNLIMESGIYGRDNGDYSPEQAAQDFIKKYNLKLNESTGKYDCDGDMEEIEDPKDRYYDGWQIPVPLGVVKGNFTNVEYHNVDGVWRTQDIYTWFSCHFKSFKNFPTRVEGNFVIHVDNHFRATDMTGMPQWVGGDFILDGARYLKTMVGAPSHVGGNFVCSHCYGLTDCTGAPQDIGEGVDLTWNYRLTSLKGLPRVINGDLICDKCKALNDLDHGPIRVTGKIVLAGTLPKVVQNAWKLRVSGKKSLKDMEKLAGMHRINGIAMPRGARAHNMRWKNDGSGGVEDPNHGYETPTYLDKIRGESREVRKHKRVVK